MASNSTDSLDFRQLEKGAFHRNALGVLGHPVDHSLSPAMHNAALAEMATTHPHLADWRYWRLPVPPEDLPEALARLHQAGFLGLNLTIPHKVQALDLCHAIDPAALALGAVNTLVATEHGWHGYNTDGYGIEQAIKIELSLALRGARVLLLGAGGAARAIAARCLQSGCAELWIANRDQERLQELLSLLAPHCPLGTPLNGLAMGEVPPALRQDRVLIINATSLGLKPTDPTPVDLSLFASAGIYDTTYGPHTSALLHAATVRGFPCTNGIPMLAWQGAKALEIWSGLPVPAATMQQAATNALLAR